MQDGGLCSWTNAFRVRASVAGAPFLSMHMMPYGGVGNKTNACRMHAPVTRARSFVSAHDAGLWPV